MPCQPLPPLVHAKECPTVPNSALRSSLPALALCASRWSDTVATSSSPTTSIRQKGKAGDVAQYLVGAKLMIRLGREIDVVQSNKGDRKSRADLDARTGDYEIENATIEIAVGLPDEKHLSQVAEALEDSDLEVWLLSRHDRVETWRHELEQIDGIDMKRVVVSSVESFVGQNVSELGGFSTKGKSTQLQQLFDLYNDRWIASVGTPGIRIVVKS